MSITFRKLKAVGYRSGVTIWIVDKDGLFALPYGKPFDKKHGEPHKDHRWESSVSISQSLAQKILEGSVSFICETWPNGDKYYWTDEIPVDSERQFFEFLKIDVQEKTHEYEQTKHYYQHPEYYYDLKGAQ